MCYNNQSPRREGFGFDYFCKDVYIKEVAGAAFFKR